MPGDQFPLSDIQFTVCVNAAKIPDIVVFDRIFLPELCVVSEQITVVGTCINARFDGTLHLACRGDAKGGINGRGSEKGLIIMKPADIICSRIVQRTAILGLIAAGRDMQTDISVAVELLYDRQRVCNHGQPVIR